MFIKLHLMRRSLALALTAIVLTGCSTLTIDGADGLRGKRTYVGVIRVEAPINPDDPLAPSRVRMLEVTTWGLRIDRGLSVGYLNDRLVSVPLDCRFVIFIRSTQELAQAEALLRNLSKEDTCIARTS